MGSHLRVRAIVSRYRDRLAYFKGLQQLQGSTWSDRDVVEAMAPHRAEAKRALYEVGLDRDQVEGLLADPSPGPRPARTLGQYVNDLFRARGG